jgi:hypothetical protein
MSDKLKDGGPAFPINNNDVITIVTNNGNHPEGMSLRDYFAAKAMQSIINNYKTRFIEDREFFYDIIAEESYKLADAMLEARGK